MAPRRIVTFNWVTADGYFAGIDGNLGWVVPDAEQARAAAAGISRFDTVVFGRRTYELFEGFWATVSGARHDSGRAEQNDQDTLLPEHEGRNVGALPLASRTGPARD
jgi:dihydrofolate reductase